MQKEDEAHETALRNEPVVPAGTGMLCSVQVRDDLIRANGVTKPELPGYVPTETHTFLSGQLMAASDPVGTVGFGVGTTVQFVFALAGAVDTAATTAATSKPQTVRRRASVRIRECYTRGAVVK